MRSLLIFVIAALLLALPGLAIAADPQQSAPAAAPAVAPAAKAPATLAAATFCVTSSFMPDNSAISDSKLTPRAVAVIEWGSEDPMPRAAKVEVDSQVYEMQVRICKAFANATRLQMLDLLANRELTVSELQAALRIPTPNVSQHLAILKAAGVVGTRREGKQIYCSLTLPEVKRACGLIREVLRAQIRNGRKLAI